MGTADILESVNGNILAEVLGYYRGYVTAYNYTYSWVSGLNGEGTYVAKIGEEQDTNANHQLEYTEVVNAINTTLSAYGYQVDGLYSTAGTTINIYESFYNTVLDSQGISETDVFYLNNPLYATLIKLNSHPSYDVANPMTNKVAGNWRMKIEINFLDADQDRVPDFYDNCINTPNYDQLNNDNDNLGDICDPDDDNDGVNDTEDAFPFDPTESVDTDNDGIGNNADSDDDNDGYPDEDDCSPLDKYLPRVYYLDNDGDGYGDPNNPLPACSKPLGYSSYNTDCNDNDANQNQNTDWVYFEDLDNDGYVDPNWILGTCENPGEPYEIYD